MNQNSRGIWTGIVVILVIAALGIWWLASGRPLDTLVNFGSNRTGSQATSTATTTATSTGSTSRTVTRSQQDVASIVASLSNATQFNSLFVSSGVAATISPKSVSKYTIFVPSNAAFSRLPSGTISKMTAAEKKRLVQYAIVSGRAIDADAQVAGNIQALSGDMLNFTFQGGLPLAGSGKIVAEYQGTNGVVYVIDAVNLPPQKSAI